MFGYNKTMKLCLGQYLLALLLHVVYGFAYVGHMEGLSVLIVSCVMFALTVLLVLVVKKEEVAVTLTFISVIVSTSIIGCILHTLAFSLLIYAVSASIITIFLEAKYIINWSIESILAITLYMLFFTDEILAGCSSLALYGSYVIIYICALANMIVVVYNTKKYLAGMQEKAKEAEQATESKMLFLANMSHEIRTPMNAICGMAELLTREDMSKAARENVRGIQTSGQVLLSIVNDILDYSKMESGHMEIILSEYSIRSVVKEAENMMSLRLIDKDVELRVEIDPSVPEVMIGDEIRIRQIILNLLNNAIKFTEKGYVVLEVTGEKVNQTEDNKNIENLKITVTDSGIGIRKEDITRLFTSFQQVDTRRYRSYEGTGLGLAICKQLLNLMHGSIDVESTYGVGSKFTITFPQEISDHELNVVERFDEKVEIEETIIAPSAKVMVVDDNAVNLKVAEGLLRTFGMIVDTAKSGRDCLELLKSHKDYDIIFLDHMMPELDGIDTLNLIRADSNEFMQTVPVIALTANVVSGVREMFIEEGFTDYVPKPIEIVWLNSILRKYLPKEKQIVR